MPTLQSSTLHEYSVVCGYNEGYISTMGVPHVVHVALSL